MKINCELTMQVIRKLQSEQVFCYIVGGYVRDSLLGIESKDIDIELHNISATRAYEIISSVTEADYFGSFGVIALKHVPTEFAIARTERKVGTQHTNFEIEFITNGDLKLASSRRDFTINSMLYDMQTKQLIDYYHGKIDLEQRVLQHVSPAFTEDSLRVLRGLKFVGRYQLSIAESTDLLCMQLAKEMKYLPTARIENELLAIFETVHYQQTLPYLTKYLNQIFQQPLQPIVNNGCPKLAIVHFFQQFPDYLPVINFCFERKKFKRDLVFVLDNYQRYINFSKLKPESKYELLQASRYVIAEATSINPHVAQYYDQYLRLKVKYDGNYFISRGYEKKQIAQAMALKIGVELDEL